MHTDTDTRTDARRAVEGLHDGGGVLLHETATADGGAVVLAEWRGEFVTWRYYCHGGLNGGHYYTDGAAAAADYYNRAARGY